ncbi:MULTISPECIES: hypothetical protein [unclassified Streptomyces]|uniref:hypothetical protein n=1 Tax=unclassified Streptomyces TaxID=2593676 RepID=UPI002E11B922|nr:hypothetical protein OG452_20890 [Streptomyces sp. NBC_01197]WSS49717.1 hypothetical protein OG708_14355 [Streptomyces sp. NBC_01180]
MPKFIARLVGPAVRFLNLAARRRPAPPPPLVVRRRRLLVCRAYLPLGHQLRPNLGSFSALAYERLEYSRIAWFDLHGVEVGPPCPLHGVVVR